MKKNRKTLIIGINLCDSGSTGTIMRNSIEYASQHGDFDYLVIVPYDEGKPNTFAYKYQFSICKRLIYNKILKIYKNYPDGYYYREYTKIIIKKIEECRNKYDKVIVHLHNIHMAGINFPMLFKYLSKTVIRVYYTLHDAWPFTGGCYYFNYIKCFDWQTGCRNKCCQDYDKLFMRVRKNYLLKEKYTTMLRKDQLTLIPVSHWMEEQIKHSFLKDYKVILNPGECSIIPLGKPDLTLKHDLGLDDKKILISVSAYWNDWKGKKYLYELSRKLPNDYILLVIGGTFNTDGYHNITHINSLPNQELARYYSISNVFVSTTQDDNLPLVLMEAQICGLPIVGFGHGGTPEQIIEGKTGYMVGEENDIGKMVNAVINVVDNKPFKEKDIIKNGERFAPLSCAKRMFDLYEKRY